MCNFQWSWISVLEFPVGVTQFFRIWRRKALFCPEFPRTGKYLRTVADVFPPLWNHQHYWTTERWNSKKWSPSSYCFWWKPKIYIRTQSKCTKWWKQSSANKQLLETPFFDTKIYIFGFHQKQCASH